MGTQKLSCNICLILMIATLIIQVESQLSEKFYRKSCPQLESVVRQAVTNKYRQTFVTGQATLRLFFHDCFVQGCDASVMIYSPNNDAEKDAPENLSLAGDGFDTVIKAKQAVEAVCPEVVSCADILALATRDVVVLTGGPFFTVELGRRDSLRSKSSDVSGNLPSPFSNLSQLVSLFSRHNLSQTDMIALSGAHTIGASHCEKFSSRLSNPLDPTIDPTYAKQLKQLCANPSPGTVVPMDPITPGRFDNLCFRELMQGRGLFTSDQVLFTDLKSRPTVVGFANSAGQFNAAFVAAMRKLGRVGVKTGNQGEIRRNCAAFN